MMKRNDGYTLAYVVVVLGVMATVALATMSLALMPQKNQHLALERMQDKYTAQGMVEQVIALLEQSTVAAFTDEVLVELLTHTVDCDGLIIDLDESTSNINVKATVNDTIVTAALKLEQQAKTEFTGEVDDTGKEITNETIVGYAVTYLSYTTTGEKEAAES